MKKINFRPLGVCCKEISFKLDWQNVITHVNFLGGCPGNQIGIKQLVEGQGAKIISEKLTGITCGNRNTSCPD